MTHAELHEQIAAYALDALSPDEARAVEAHLASCPDCRRELTRFREVATELAVAVGQAIPPAELREQILARIHVDRERRAAPVRRLWSTAAAVLIVALAAGVTVLTQRVAALQRQLRAQEQLLTVLAGAPRTAVLAGSVRGSVRLVFDPVTGRGVLVAAAMDDPGVDRVYQLWFVAGAQPESAGVFRPAPDRPTLLPVTADFARFQVVAISVEPAPRGSAAPTTTPVLAGNF